MQPVSELGLRPARCCAVLSCLVLCKIISNMRGSIQGNKVSTTAAYLRYRVVRLRLFGFKTASHEAGWPFVAAKTLGTPTGNFAWGPLSTRATTAGPGKFAGAKRNATTIRKRGRFRCVVTMLTQDAAVSPPKPRLCFRPRRNVWKRILCGQPVLFEACSVVFPNKAARQTFVCVCVCVCVRVCVYGNPASALASE